MHLRAIATVLVTASCLAACSGGSGTVDPIALPDQSTIGPGASTTVAGPTGEDPSTTAPGGSETPGGDGEAAAVLDPTLGDSGDVATAPLVVLLDGWSAASLSSAGIDWRSPGQLRGTPVRWRAASGADLATVAGRDPAAVTAIAARIVTADPSLRCDGIGCMTDTRSISFDELVDPRTGHLFGEQFRAWGITTGVYLATSDAARGELVYGSSTLDVALVSGEDFDDPDATIETGVRTVAMAFGRLFSPEPAWLGGAATYTSLFPVGDGSAQVGAAADLFGGLGNGVAGIAALHPSELTWRSSPTTGCGVGALCVPGVVTASVEVDDQRDVPVCGEFGDGVVELFAADVTYDYPGATHQFGLWPSAPDGVVDGRGIVWTRDVPFVAGPQTMRVTLALLYDARGLVQVTGLVADHATATDAEVTRRYAASEIATLFDGALATC